MVALDNKLTTPISWPVVFPAGARDSLLGPPLPSWWPRPGKRIRLDAAARRTTVEPWHKVSLGPGKLVLQIATRW